MSSRLACPIGARRSWGCRTATARTSGQRDNNLHNGRGGIRTHGTLLTYTHFPGVRLKPLGHPSLHQISARTTRVPPGEQRRGSPATDRERFELSIPGSPVCRFSRPVPSTTRPPVLQPRKLLGERGLFNPRQQDASSYLPAGKSRWLWKKSPSSCAHSSASTPPRTSGR